MRYAESFEIGNYGLMLDLYGEYEQSRRVGQHWVQQTWGGPSTGDTFSLPQFLVMVGDKRDLPPIVVKVLGSFQIVAPSIRLPTLRWVPFI